MKIKKWDEKMDNNDANVNFINTDIIAQTLEQPSVRQYGPHF